MVVWGYTFTMSAITRGSDNDHQNFGSSVCGVGNVNTQGSESTEKIKARDENEELVALLRVFRDGLTSDPEPTMEEELARNVEKFFQDEPEFTVVVEDFRDALNAQLVYYKQRVALFKSLCDNIRKERDQAENHVRLIEIEATNVGSSASTNGEALQAIAAIQAAVQECSQKLNELSNKIPVSIEPGTPAGQNPIHSVGTNSSFKSERNLLGINQLVDDCTLSIQNAIKAIQSACSVPTSSSNIFPQFKELGQPGSGIISRGIAHTTCRQRLKERELEVERLEARLRLAGGTVTDHLMQPGFLFKGMGLGSDEIDEISKMIEKLQEQLETPNDPNDKLAYYKDLLGKQLAADPTDLGGAAKSIRKEIERREKEKANVGITIAKGNNQEFKKLLQMIRAKLKSHQDSLNKYKHASNDQDEIHQIETGFWPETIKELGADSVPNYEKLSILTSKNTIIDVLRKEVQDAHAEAARYLEEIETLKKDADSKVTDLQKRLTDCILLFPSLVCGKKDTDSRN